MIASAFVAATSAPSSMTANGACIGLRLPDRTNPVTELRNIHAPLVFRSPIFVLVKAPPTDIPDSQGFETEPSDVAQARMQRLLSGSQAALRHALALRQMQALHRIALHRSHFNPNQPRVPAGNPDGGQWTATGGGLGTRLAAADKPRPGRFALVLEVIKRLIEAYRSENGLWDLFGHEEGTVAWTEFNGTDIYGSSSGLPTYTRVDRAAALEMRNILVQKYPELKGRDNIGQMPINAIFHAETTVLLRAARANGGTLAGRTLEVFVDGRLCNNCKPVLPKVGLELGNPTVTFIDHTGKSLTMRNGKWN